MTNKNQPRIYPYQAQNLLAYLDSILTLKGLGALVKIISTSLTPIEPEDGGWKEN